MKNEQFVKLRRHRLYWELIRGRRTSVGNRWLNAIWPTPEEARQTFTPRFAYLNHIGPGDTAGNHFHAKKREFFCPLGDLVLVLYDRSRKKAIRVRMSNRTKRQYTMYYIPPHVPHAVENKTKQFQPLVVLTNERDAYSSTTAFSITK